ncbi:unnamed protein product [Brassica oleracea]
MKENVEPDSDDQAKPLMKEIIVNTSLADWLASPKTFHGNGLCKRSQLGYRGLYRSFNVFYIYAYDLVRRKAIGSRGKKEQMDAHAYN